MAFKEQNVKPPHYLGHRKRLKQRFIEGGGKPLTDYEMLELVLFRTLPRQDTKPIAKDLIQLFGSFSAVLNAPSERLLEVKGIGDAAVTEFKIIRSAALLLMREEISDKPVVSSWDALISYCHAAMAHEKNEQFRILFLDKRNRLIADEVQQEGTVDHTPVYIREVIKRALELSATAIILVHNHPSGDPSPSRADIEMTNQIIVAAQNLGIEVHDHIIIGKEGHMSFKGEGLIS